MSANILVIKHGAFGDFVQALGAMRAIRKHHPHAKITLLTTKPFAALAEASGYFDAIAIDRRPKWYDLPKIFLLRRFFNTGKFLRVYDLQNSERTGLYLGMFRRRPEWNGIAWNASLRIADDAQRKAMHVFDALRAQLAVASIKGVTFDDLSWVTADVSGFRLKEPYVLVVPGCSPTRAIKRWPAERFAAVCGDLAGRGITPVLLGTKDDAGVTRAIAAACPQAVDLTDRTTLFHIPPLARKALAAIGNDTGPIQMIGPTGCKTIGLFPAFSNPARHGPLGPHVKTIVKPAMADISVEDVLTALNETLPMAA